MNSPCGVISPRPARPRGDPFLSYQNTGNLRLRGMSFCGVQANLAETLWGNKSLLLPPLKACTLPQSKTKEYLVPALKLNDIKPQLITLQNCWMLDLCSALASSVWGVGEGSTKQRGVVRKLEALVIPILARGMCLYLIFKSLSIKARGLPAYLKRNRRVCWRESVLSFSSPVLFLTTEQPQVWVSFAILPQRFRPFDYQMTLGQLNALPPWLCQNVDCFVSFFSLGSSVVKHSLPNDWR